MIYHYINNSNIIYKNQKSPICHKLQNCFAQLAGAVEYTDCFSEDTRIWQ